MAVKVKLKTYLAQLEDGEVFKPQEQRFEIPTVSALADEAGITRAQMHRILANDIKSLKLDVADSIIKSMRRRGFVMDVSDLLEFRD